MEDDVQRKTLHYRRIHWLMNSERQTMQQHLVRAHEEMTTTAARTIGYSRGQIQGLVCEPRIAGFFLHLAYSVPGQHASVVRRPCENAECPVGTSAPPREHDYMEGDMLLLVAGDHMVFCCTTVHESVAQAYLTHCLSVCGYDDPRGAFTLEKIASIDKLRMLEMDGVRSIGMGASLYDASLDYEERAADTTRRRLLRRMGEEFIALFANDRDPELRDLHEKENLQVKIEISFDSRKRGGEVGRKRIEKTAARLVEEQEDEGFTIRTRSGRSITASEIRLSTQKRITTHGNSVSRSDAWAKLEEYLAELRETGALEQ